MSIRKIFFETPAYLELGCQCPDQENRLIFALLTPYKIIICKKTCSVHRLKDAATKDVAINVAVSF